MRDDRDQEALCLYIMERKLEKNERVKKLKQFYMLVSYEQDKYYEINVVSICKAKNDTKS